MKKDVGMGLLVRFLALPSPHPCTFLENVLFTCLCHFCCTIVHHIGGCSSSALPLGTKKQTRDHRQLLLCVMGWEYIARS